MQNDNETSNKPNWTDVANLIINFGLLVVAVLALIFK